MRLLPIESRRFRLTSWAAIISFSCAASGCVTTDDVRVAEPAAITIDVRVPGPDGGWLDVMQEQLPPDELPVLADEYVLTSGLRTRDPAVALAAPGFSVEVSGGRLDFRRDGDVVELIGAPASGTPRGAPPVQAVRLDGNRAVFHVGDSGWRGRPADVELTVTSADPARTARELRAMAMTLLLAPHQDRPQIAWFAVIGIVGAGWLAFCGGALLGCSDACACYSGYKLNCLGFSVSRIDGEWDVSFEGIGCTCYLPKLPGCDES